MRFTFNPDGNHAMRTMIKPLLGAAFLILAWGGAGKDASAQGL
jgi:hypothetical protein